MTDTSKKPSVPSKMIDVVHAELLSDVQKLRKEVNQLTEEIPSLYKSVESDIEKSSEKVQTTFSEFENVSKAMAIHINNVKTDGLSEIKSLSKNLEDSQMQMTKFIKKTLDPFTKYLWLISGLASFSILLNIALIVVVFLK